MESLTVALHLGPVHPVEQALTLLLAFGPFVVLGIVVVKRRRDEVGAEQTEASGPLDPEGSHRRDARKSDEVTGH